MSGSTNYEQRLLSRKLRSAIGRKGPVVDVWEIAARTSVKPLHLSKARRALASYGFRRSSKVCFQECGGGNLYSFRFLRLGAGKSMADAFQRKKFVLDANLREA